eukprot:6192665-Pleurochrysis_carterae.AAC.2
MMLALSSENALRAPFLKAACLKHAVVPNICCCACSCAIKQSQKLWQLAATRFQTRFSNVTALTSQSRSFAGGLQPAPSTLQRHTAVQ